MEDKKHICKFCGKEFDTGVKLGGHIRLCKANPKYKEIRHHFFTIMSNHAKEKYPKLTFKVKCEYCGKEYLVIATQHTFDVGSYCHTCSTECAHKLSNKNTNIKLKNENISKGLKKFFENTAPKEKNYKIKYCNYCGKEYSTKDRGQSIYCSDECMKESRHKKLSESAYKNKTGGLKPETTHKYYKRGYYKGIWCDSSWELAYLIYCLEHNINIERNKQYIEYEFQNKKFKFYPDFLVNGELVEIKGFYTPKNLAKREQIDNVKFIDKKLIEPYLKYTIEKYGKSFTDLLINKKFMPGWRNRQPQQT